MGSIYTEKLWHLIYKESISLVSFYIYTLLPFTVRNDKQQQQQHLLSKTKLRPKIENT